MRVVAFGVLLALGALAQTPRFAPLQQWAAAVRGGDAGAIAALYSSSPLPALVVSTGVITDVPREAQFWATWKRDGLRRLALDMIVDQPVNGQIHQVGFEAEIALQLPSGAQTVYAFVQQTWVKEAAGWRIVSGGRSDLSRLKQPTALTRVIYSKQADAHADIVAALARAAAAHKRVLLVFGGNWCYDCHVLELAFERSDLAPLLKSGYELVNVDVENFDYNLDIVKQYHLSIDKGVPMVAVLDSRGQVLMSSQDGAFESARALGPEDLIRFLAAWKP